MTTSIRIDGLRSVAPPAVHIAHAAPKLQILALFKGIKSAWLTNFGETRSPLSGRAQKTFGGNTVSSKGIFATFVDTLKKVFSRGFVRTEVHDRAAVQSPRVQMDAVQQLVKKQVATINQMKLKIGKINGTAASKRNAVAHNIPERSAGKPVTTVQEMKIMLEKAKKLPRGEQRQQEMQKIRSAANEFKRSASPARSANTAYVRQQRGAAELNKLDAEIIKTGRAGDLWRADKLHKSGKN